MLHTKLRYVLAGLVVAVLALPVLSNAVRNQPVEAHPRDFAETMFSHGDWLKWSRHEAALNGLVGNPEQENIAVMTYGSYSVLIGQNPNPVLLSRDSLVVVYQVLGDIPELNGFGSAAGRTDIAGFIFVYDAQTGVNILSTALVKGKPGVLDLNFIPADTGEVPSIDPARMPTVIPTNALEVPPPIHLPPESTAEPLPLPLN